MCLCCTMKKPYMGWFLLLYPTFLPVCFYTSELRRSNYYLTSIFKSKVSDYVSSRKMAGCVIKFWMLPLNLAEVCCFLSASNVEHCAFDCCFWSLIKTLKGQRKKDWSKVHSFTIHTAQSKRRNQPHTACLSVRIFVQCRVLFLWEVDRTKWPHLF